MAEETPVTTATVEASVTSGTGNPLIASVKPYATAAWNKFTAMLNVVWSSIQAVWLPKNYPALASFFAAGVFFATPVMHRLERHGFIAPVASEKLVNSPLAADRSEVILAQIQQLALRQTTFADYVTKRTDETAAKVAEISKAGENNRVAIDGVAKQLADISALALQLAGSGPFSAPLGKPAPAVAAPAAAPEPVKKVKTTPVKPSAPVTPQPVPAAAPAQSFPWSLFGQQ